MNAFICSKILLLFIAILILNGYLPLKTIYVLLVEIFIPYLEVIFSNICIEICIPSSESATVTWSTENKSVLMTLLLDKPAVIT